MLACPECQKPFTEGRCACRADWTETGGVQDLWASASEAGENAAASERARSYYEEHSENEYRPDETAQSLADEAREGARADRVAAAVIARGQGRLRILDVGCGQGRRVNQLALAGHDTLGIDLAMTPLLRAEAMRRRVGAVGGSFVRANLFRLPVVRASVDLVIATDVIDETGSPEAAVAALAPAVRAGGWLAVSVSAFRLPFFASTAIEGAEPPPERSAHSLDEVCTWFESAGVDPRWASNRGDTSGVLATQGVMGTATRLVRSFAWTAHAAPGVLLVAGTRRK